MKNNKISLRLKIVAVAAIALAGVFSSCNKALPDAEPINPPVLNPEASQSIGSKIESDANYSIYLAAVKRVPGLLDRLKDKSNTFTAFVPDNAGFQASGISSAAVINAMPLASVIGMVQYSLLPGQQHLSGEFSAFPNTQFPTSLNIGTLPGTPVPLQMSIFPSKLSNGFWVNNIPVKSADEKYTNGTIHKMAALVAPPSKLLSDEIYSNPDLLYFKNAIEYADAGATGTASLNYLMGYAVMNMTVLVPNNAAFQELIYGLAYGYYIGLGLTPAQADGYASALAADPNVFKIPGFSALAAPATVKGILAYHFLASEATGFQPMQRIFSNNFATTPSFYQTLVNGSVPEHPGVKVTTTYSSGMVSAVSFTGMGTFPPGGAPFSGPAANATSKDKNCVNGVYYVIDKILLPQ
ncbi:MAG TPA: fasciclin domain-containing protein [Ginsengibacter sp.]|nr:fasciclin domain-containing protein [Chitinophagales bacterium]HRN72451.1 fasciclin domain-containing protein [Ginsengibacter sp.]HRP17229.1 fasciclin domain-containing protein [Ginsengibacter sp.]HRP44293.1 fasciclin domain-containing protein [Ginsengibacter sp.]